MKKVTKTLNYSSLITDLAFLIDQGRKAAVRYVNTALVTTYWLMGRRIVEYEQKGKERAEYGEALFGKDFKEHVASIWQGVFSQKPEKYAFFLSVIPNSADSVCRICNEIPDDIWKI